MFKQWRIDKLTIKIAGLEAEITELDKIVHCGNAIPIYYIDELTRKLNECGCYKKEKELLELAIQDKLLKKVNI